MTGPLKISSARPVRLDRIDPDATPGVADRAAAKEELHAIHDRLKKKQQMLYAQARHAVLVVIQAIDTGGKDGVIRHVFGPLNPQGVQVTNFKVPNAEEAARDYLWRIHRAVPPRGHIGIFNRSHYEDVLITRVHKLFPLREIDRRYAQINAFEKHLSENGVTIIKCLLHISREEQKRRLESRLSHPNKHWKFSSADLREREKWSDYRDAFERMLRRCSTSFAPWYVIPANKKWYRNLAVGRIVLERLERLDLAFPPAEKGLDRITIGD